MLLAALNLDKKKFKFDTTKHAMILPDLSRSSLKRSLDEDRLNPRDKDLYIDLREHLLPQDLSDLVYLLTRLNGISGVWVR